MKKYEMMRIDRLTSSISRYAVTVVLVAVILLVSIVMLLFRTNTILDVDAKVSESDVLHIKPVVTNLEVARTYVADGDDTVDRLGAYASSAQFDDNVYNTLLAGGYDDLKAIAMTYAWCTLSPMFSPEFAIGVMGNIVAEGAPGVVEYKFSQEHAHGFSLPSGKTTVQNAVDVEYLRDWDSKSTSVDKSVKKGSCGFGMAQMSFERRVRLCDAYLTYVNDYSDIHQLAQAEIMYIVDEVKSGSPYDYVVDDCRGKSPEDCAKIVCNEFERPGGSAQAVIRAGYATDIVNVLGALYTK